MRVVSLAPSNTEILLALGLGGQLVAVTSYCRLPAEMAGLTRLPGWTSIKAADVLALKPDLVLTSSICQASLRQQLEAAGCRLHHADPRTLDEVAHSFIEISVLFGIQAQGRQLSRDFHASIDTYKAQSWPSRPRIYVEEWDKPPMAAGNWVPEMVLAAGAEPFDRKLGELSREVTWEELMEFDPEMVVYSICGVGKAFDPKSFLSVEGWNTLSAARTGRLYSVDDSLFNVPGPGLIKGIEALRQLIEGRQP
jgi:iron complex transport system substrate-binding protein